MHKRYHSNTTQDIDIIANGHFLLLQDPVSGMNCYKFTMETCKNCGDRILMQHHPKS